MVTLFWVLLQGLQQSSTLVCPLIFYSFSSQFQFQFQFLFVTHRFDTRVPVSISVQFSLSWRLYKESLLLLLLLFLSPLLLLLLSVLLIQMSPHQSTEHQLQLVLHSDLCFLLIEFNCELCITFLLLTYFRNTSIIIIVIVIIIIIIIPHTF